MCVLLQWPLVAGHYPPRHAHRDGGSSDTAAHCERNVKCVCERDSTSENNIISLKFESTHNDLYIIDIESILLKVLLTTRE